MSLIMVLPDCYYRVPVVLQALIPMAKKINKERKKLLKKFCEMNQIFNQSDILICCDYYDIPEVQEDSHLLKNLHYLLHWKPLKMIKHAFHFILKALFILKIFKFLSWLFDHVEKTTWLEWKVNFKIHDITTWLTNNCNTYISHHLRKQKQPDNETWSTNII